MKEFQKAQSLLSEPFGFALIDGIVTGFEDYEKLENYAMKAPEKSSRGSLLRVPLESIAKAMRLSRPLYEKNLKQKHKEQFQKKLQDIEKGFSPHEQDVVDFMIRGLRFPKETLRVPIILVAFAPHPGGLTVRSSNNGAVCIIGMSQFSGSTFYEAIVHESIHAFDATFASSDNALSMLREMLLRNGVGREDAIYRNLPHTLMFVHSAEAIRKYVNRKHRPYGETSGYYSKMGKISELVETHWQEYLKKGDNLETTLQLVVEKALKNT
ncbi:MAG TPA: hypothetical protein VNK96_09790 [Fimbriimonadales bacterium]|nr:hypothetical protein [Fimbriimonadales bacterium]